MGHSYCGSGGCDSPLGVPWPDLPGKEQGCSSGMDPWMRELRRGYGSELEGATSLAEESWWGRMAIGGSGGENYEERQ